MTEKETKVKELKKELRPFDVLSTIMGIVAIIAIILICLGSIFKENAIFDKLFGVGVGSLATVVVFLTSGIIIRRKQIDELTKLVKEIKKAKK